jgi:hypothetical protein
MSSGFARHIRRQVSRSSHDATSSAAEIDCGSAWNGLSLGAFAGSALAIANSIHGIQGEGDLWKERANGLFVPNHPVLCPALLDLLAVVVVKETRNPPLQLGRLPGIAGGIVAIKVIEGNGVVEQLTLELRGERTPPHHDGRSQALQDMLMLVEHDATLPPIDLRCRHDIVFKRRPDLVRIAHQPFLVADHYRAALFQIGKFLGLARRARTVEQSRVFGCFRVELLYREHVDTTFL